MGKEFWEHIKKKKWHPLSGWAAGIGLMTMIAFYMTAGFAGLIARHGDYLRAMAVQAGCIEAAPASLAAGVCAALLGDMMLHRGQNPNKTDKHDRPGE